jgi:hypothetical protein
MAEDTLQKQTKSTATKRKGSDDIANLELWYYQIVGFYEQNQNLVIGIGYCHSATDWRAAILESAQCGS